MRFATKNVCAGLGLALALTVTPVHADTSDAWITTKAKLALLTTEGVSGSAINVDTVNGQITLHGKARTAEEKAKAAAAVANIDGAKGVRNLLQVVPEAENKPVQKSDDEIKQQAEKTLKADTALADSSIKVQSVNNGVVLLGGTAKTLTAHLRAVQEVAAVPGVRRVASEIQSPDKLADSEIWREPMAKAKGSSRNATNAATDTWITSATKMRLLADSSTPALDINVDTRNGIVTLFGIVPTETAKASAAADARKVSGVKQVVNELQVVSAAKQEAVKAQDADLQKELKTAFQDRNDFKHVSVEVKNGVARLTGSVPGQSERLHAAVVARSTPGVRSVRDELRIAD